MQIFTEMDLADDARFENKSRSTHTGSNSLLHGSHALLFIVTDDKLGPKDQYVKMY